MPLKVEKGKVMNRYKLSDLGPEYEGIKDWRINTVFDVSCDLARWGCVLKEKGFMKFYGELLDYSDQLKQWTLMELKIATNPSKPLGWELRGIFSEDVGKGVYELHKKIYKLSHEMSHGEELEKDAAIEIQGYLGELGLSLFATFKWDNEIEKSELEKWRELTGRFINGRKKA